MHLDSQTKLSELQRIFNAYQDINVDLATKLSQPYKEEVAQLESRVRKQKQRCWKDEERALDTDMADLKDDVDKIYGENEMIAKPTKKRAARAVASVVPAAKPVEAAAPSETSTSFELPPPEPVPMGKADSDDNVIPNNVE